MKKKKLPDDLAWTANYLRSLDFIIANPVLETPRDVRVFKAIRKRMKAALKKL